MQKDDFKSDLGDWYTNRLEIVGSSKKRTGQDLLFDQINKLKKKPSNFLEVGTGNGWRLREINEKFQIACSGIDPSEKAINLAKKNNPNPNIDYKISTADNLPYQDDSFDIIFFGFCLFLVDREDLFKVAYETDRVLRENGHIIILDFYTPYHTSRNFYNTDLKSYKTDYSKIFSWHPHYHHLAFETFSHTNPKKQFSSDFSESLAMHVIEKKIKNEI
jgi:ubiquinone/menaquinone biosynthesis C-methylase UbiE